MEKRKKFFKEQEEERERLRIEIRKQEAEEAERLEKRRLRRQQTFTWIAKNTKWIAFILAAALVCFIGYWVFHLYLYMVAHFCWEKFVRICTVIGIILAGVAAIIGIGFVIYKIGDRCKAACLSCKMTWLTKSLKYVGKFFVMIGGFLSFMWNGAIMFKKEYCPGIIWEEKK